MTTRTLKHLPLAFCLLVLLIIAVADAVHHPAIARPKASPSRSCGADVGIPCCCDVFGEGWTCCGECKVVGNSDEITTSCSLCCMPGVEGH